MNRSIRIIIGVAVAIVLAIVAFVLITLALRGDFSQDDEVILRPEVVIYEEGVSPFVILASDEDSITVSSMEGIEPDSVIAAGVTEATPVGLLRKYTEAIPVEGGYRLTTVQASLTEAIERCNVSAQIDLMEDGTYVIEQTGTPETSFIEQAYAAQSLGFSYNFENGPLEGGISNSIEVDIDIDGWLNCDFELVDHIQAYAKLNQPELKFMEDEGNLLKKNLRPFTVHVGPLPVVFTTNLSVDYSTEGTLKGTSFSAGVGIDKRIGFSYSSSSGLRPVVEDASWGPEATFDPEESAFSFDMEGDLTVSITCQLYDFAGPQMSAGLAADASYRLMKAPDGSTTSECIHVPGVNWDLMGSVHALVYIPLQGRFLLNVPDPLKYVNIFDTNRDPIELANFELFNTGDEIKLFEIDKRYGGATRTYVLPSVSLLKVQGGTFTSEGSPRTTVTSPSLAFDYPMGWSVKEERNTGTGTATTESEASVVLEHDSGLQISITVFSVSDESGSATGSAVQTLANTRLPADEGNPVVVYLYRSEYGNYAGVGALTSDGRSADTVMYEDYKLSALIIAPGQASSISDDVLDSDAFQEAVDILASLHTA